MQLLTKYIFTLPEIFLTSHHEQKCRPSLESTATEDAMPLMLYFNNQTDQVTSTMYITMICTTAVRVPFTEFSFVQFARTVFTTSTSDLPSEIKKHNFNLCKTRFVGKTWFNWKQFGYNYQLFYTVLLLDAHICEVNST